VASEWDLRTGEQLRTFGGHGDFIWAIAVEGTSLFTASSEAKVKQWSLDTGDEIRQFQPDTNAGPESHVWSIATTESHLYTGDSEGGPPRAPCRLSFFSLSSGLRFLLTPFLLQVWRSNGVSKEDAPSAPTPDTMAG